MEHGTEQAHFEEEQRFPLWIKGFASLVLGLVGLAMVSLWLAGSPLAPAVAVSALTVLFLALTVLTFAMRLSTRVDSSHLRLRVHPTRWCLLPRRMAVKDVALRDISSSRVATYHALRDTEFWGWHVWGLSVSRTGRYSYLMRPSSPLTGRGVRLELDDGDVLLVGSPNPGRLAEALARAIGPAR